MQGARREILAQVAAGTLTPTEAATRLDEVERGQTEAPAARVASSEGADIRGVRVRSDFGRIIVIGDASVDQATAEGPHVARHENGILGSSPTRVTTVTSGSASARGATGGTASAAQP